MWSEKQAESARVNYWEIIVNRLKTPNQAMQQTPALQKALSVLSR
jgi:hypothetical protein